MNGHEENDLDLSSAPLTPNVASELLATGDHPDEQEKPMLWPVSSTGLLGQGCGIARLATLFSNGV